MAEEKNTLGLITLTGLRLGFPFIYQRSEPSKDDDGNERPGNFRCNGIMYREGEFAEHTKRNMALLKKAKEAVMAAKFGPDQKKWPKIKADKICVRDGDEENWDGYAGAWYVSASEKDQPLLLSRRKDEDGNWEPARPGEIYGGCYVSLIIQLWVQDNKHGKRVNANLKAVQFFKKGDSFSSSTPIDPTKAFLGIEAEDDDHLGSGSGGGGFSDDDDEDSVV